MLEIDLRAIAGLVESETWMRVPPEAIKAVVGPLRKCELEEFVVLSMDLVEPKCIALLVSYCCKF